MRICEHLEVIIQDGELKTFCTNMDARLKHMRKDRHLESTIQITERLEIKNPVVCEVCQDFEKIKDHAKHSVCKHIRQYYDY